MINTYRVLGYKTRVLKLGQDFTGKIFSVANNYCGISEASNFKNSSVLLCLWYYYYLQFLCVGKCRRFVLTRILITSMKIHRLGSVHLYIVYIITLGTELIVKFSSYDTIATNTWFQRQYWYRGNCTTLQMWIVFVFKRLLRRWVTVVVPTQKSKKFVFQPRSKNIFLECRYQYFNNFL